MTDTPLHDNETARWLRENSTRPSHDSVAKFLFSNPEILAHFLKGVIQEYKDCSIEQILHESLNKTEIVFKDDTKINPPPLNNLVSTINPQILCSAQSSIFCDVLLLVPVPGQDSYIIVDIEVQNKIEENYESRILAYLTIIMARENGFVYFHSNYQKMIKVYSIWLFPRANTTTVPAIRSLKLSVESLLGLEINPELCKRLDMLRGIWYIFNKNMEFPKYSIERFLQLLLTNCGSIDERLHELNHDFGITLTQEVQNMCTLFELAYGQGMDEGEVRGVIKGEKKGKRKCQIQILSRLQAYHFDDTTISAILNVNIEELGSLRKEMKQPSRS